MSNLEFHCMHLMSYPFVPPREDVESYWVTLSNQHYDPKLGRRLYQEYLDEVVAAERFGFDGTCINEHHQSAYGTVPAPNVMASHVIARTDGIKVGIIGNALPLHANPLRVAEEVAMLDVLSGGRVISGFVRGTGMEYHSYGLDPSESFERFWEAHDLIIKAWTEPGPFHWQGRYYNLPFANPWPRPYQQPHPPIWLPGTGSMETIDRAARHHYPFMMVFAPQWFTRMAYDMYRRAAEGYGYEATPKDLAACLYCYVAETEEQAHREAKPYALWMSRCGVNVPPYQLIPPGYMSKKSFASMVNAKAKHNVKDNKDLSYEELLDERYIIVGSPETVIERLTEVADDLGAGSIVGAAGPFGPMPHWMVMKNMQLMAEEVLPHFRDAGGSPAWAKEPRTPSTVSEWGASPPPPELRATVQMEEDGPPELVRTAWQGVERRRLAPTAGG